MRPYFNISVSFSAWILTGFLMLFCINTLLAVPPAVKQNYAFAVLSVDSIDMGQLPVGSPGLGNFQLTNTGQRELIIARVRSSCRLLITSWPDRALKPGEQAVVSFRYDTGIPGSFHRNIVIHSNSWQGTLIVPIKGEVVSRGAKGSN